MEKSQARLQRLQRMRRQQRIRYWINNTIWLLVGVLIGVLIALPYGESSQPAAASLPSETIDIAPGATSTEEAEAYNDPDIPDEVEAAAETVGERYSIVPELLEAIAWYESRYDTDALNGSHVGLMQVSVYWHNDRMEKLGISNSQLWQPEENMAVAADYLVELFEQNDDLTWVLMKYNGSKNADAYLNGKAEASEYAIEVQELMVSLLEKHDQTATAEEVTPMLAEK